MLEIPAILAILFLCLLTLASLFPVPSGILSAGTVVGYWWFMGYTEPGTITVVSLALLGLLVTAVDILSGAISAKIVGVSNAAVLASTVIGLVCLVIFGPLGFIGSVSLTIFFFSLYVEDKDVRGAVMASIYTVLGILGSNLVQGALLALLTIAFTVSVL